MLIIIIGEGLEWIQAEKNIAENIVIYSPVQVQQFQPIFDKVKVQWRNIYVSVTYRELNFLFNDSLNDSIVN